MLICSILAYFTWTLNYGIKELKIKLSNQYIFVPSKNSKQ